MYVHVFQGNMGQGKTAGAAMFALYFVVRWRIAGQEANIFSNFKMKGAQLISNELDWDNVARSPNSIVIMDEAHVNLDSRMFNRATNINLTQFIFYFRKLHCSLFLCSPSIMNLDARIRNLTNVLIDCSKFSSGFNYKIYDYHAARRINTLFIPKRVAKKFFDLGIYDTHAIIRYMQFPKSERDFDRFLDRIIAIRGEEDNAESARLAYS